MKFPSSYLSVAATFIWVGFILAISFMEAWIKFRAPGITLPLGLGIGQLVFAALNRVEIALSLIILISYVLRGNHRWHISHIYFLMAFAILVIQSIWLLPLLDQRAEIYISGGVPDKSILHFFYIILEAIKVISLFIFGIYGLKNLNQSKVI